MDLKNINYYYYYYYYLKNISFQRIDSQKLGVFGGSEVYIIVSINMKAIRLKISAILLDGIK